MVAVDLIFFFFLNLSSVKGRGVLLVFWNIQRSWASSITETHVLNIRLENIIVLDFTLSDFKSHSLAESRWFGNWTDFTTSVCS